MTAAANSSSRHVSAAPRWQQAAREQHPGADEATVMRAAEELRSEYFRGLARRSVETRRAAGTIAKAANASSRHTGSMARWEQAARELHPGADDSEIASAAAELRHRYFSEMGTRAGAARRAAAKGAAT